MLRNRFNPMRKSSFQKPTSKDLDLWLLAGCSCLLTVLAHPTAEALQSAVTSSHRGTIAAEVSRAPNQQPSPIQVAVPPQRDRIKKLSGESDAED